MSADEQGIRNGKPKLLGEFQKMRNPRGPKVGYLYVKEPLITLHKVLSMTPRRRRYLPYYVESCRRVPRGGVRRALMLDLWAVRAGFLRVKELWGVGSIAVVGKSSGVNIRFRWLGVKG